MSPRARPFAPSIAWVVLAYAVALLIGWWVHGLIDDQPPLVALAAADVAATLVVFVFSLLADNSSVYDPYWSVAPLAMAPALALGHAEPGVPLGRQLLVITLVAVWGLRLTGNWLRGWDGLGQEDWRYVDLRRQTGPLYWVVSLFGLHLMPTLCVLFGCFPLWPALAAGTRPLNGLDLVAAVVTFAAIAIEAAADEQLRVFRLTPHPPGSILDRGLWAYCRHPNYLGEIGFWWGLFLFGMAADPGALWSIGGALWITGLFVFISIPMIDRRSLKRRPAYAEHMRRVPALLPRPWRRAGGDLA
jgi:steroid 5-alpha reductase family enzyme